MSSIPNNGPYSLGLTPQVVADVRAAIVLALSKLPNLRDLNAEQRRMLLKLGAKTTDFSGKTYTYTAANLGMKPGFVDMDVYSQTVTDYVGLNEILLDLAPFFNQVSDSLMLIGSQKLTFDLACYNGFQSAAKMNVPGAELIVRELAPRYAKGTSAAKAAKRKAAAAAKPKKADESA